MSKVLPEALPGGRYGKIFVLGYGNPGRGDDGLGPALAERIESLDLAGVTVDAAYQLNIEDAAAAADHDLVILVDAAVKGSEPFSVRRVTPAADITFTSHLVSAESILAISRDSFGRVPECWLIGIRGYEFDLYEVLSEKAERNLAAAFSFITRKIERWKGNIMSKAEEKTILFIDDDPDIRSSMRIVLESSGFSVGEAATGEEGLKIAQRIKPDAVIVDLMMETVDAGSKFSQELKSSGYEGPVYLLSSAGDSVRFNLDARELGLAGIFQKPVDHKTLITTLKTKLGIN